jgi:hypothetical protein
MRALDMKRFLLTSSALLGMTALGIAGQESVGDKARAATDKTVTTTKKAARTAADKTEDVGEAAVDKSRAAARTAADKSEDAAQATYEGGKKVVRKMRREPLPIRPKTSAKQRTTRRRAV